MKVWRGAAAIWFVAAPANAASWESSHLRAMEGAADLLFAEKKCGFRIDMDHLNRWLETKGVMSPDALDYINSAYERAIRVNRELTENQCALAKASAKSIGAFME